MIDICDFAVGLSRQLDGRTMPSERPGHRLMETWHPLGVVGVISAFNFPVAVWAWNTAVALVCGDTVVWKPSEPTPADAPWRADALLDRAAAEVGAPDGLHHVVLGGRGGRPGAGRRPAGRAGQRHRVGRMGAQVAPRVAARFGRALLELGGNNAAVVAPAADLDLAAARHRVRRRRHRRPALHHAAPRSSCTPSSPTSWSRGSSTAYRTLQRRRPARRRHPGRPADQPARLRGACRRALAAAVEQGGEVAVRRRAGAGRRAPEAYYVRAGRSSGCPAQTDDRARPRPSRRSSTC